MPRKPRVHGANTTYHVTVLATGDSVLFANVDERQLMYRVLRYTLKHHDWEIRAFVLLGTHMHLVVWTRDDDLSRGMQRLLGIYGQAINKMRGRRGHIVCGRFWSKPIDRPGQELTTLRYVILNPVAAGLVERPEDWRWGSYRSQVGLEPPRDFVTNEWALRLFDEDPFEAARSLQEYVDAGVRALRSPGVRPVDQTGQP